MTVAELIVRLNQAPPNAKVVVRGYENGYNDVLELRSLFVRPNPKNRKQPMVLKRLKFMVKIKYLNNANTTF